MAQPYQMPFKGEKGAPDFDPQNPRSLIRFFDHLEECFQRANITDAQAMKKHAVKYVAYKEADAWEELTEYAAPHTFVQWKDEVVKLYPGADMTRKFTRPELEEYTRKWRANGFQNIGDWSEFYREFRASSTWLIKNGRLSAMDQKRLCYDALDDALRKRIETRLIVKYPDVHPEDGYELAQIHETVSHVFYGTSATPSFRHDTVVSTSHTASRSPPSAAVKTEDLNSFMELFAKTLERVAGNAPTSGPTSLATAAPRSTTTMGNCHFCNEPGHSIATCPVVDEDIQKGLCRRNHEGRVILPSGSFVPRSITGNCMRDRIKEWHRQHPNQTAVGMLSYAPGPPELRSTMLWTIANDATTTATAAYALGEDADTRKLEQLEREILALRAKIQAGPVRRSPRNHAGPMPPPSVPQKEVPQPANQPIASESHPAPLPPAPVQTEMPEHPFSKARDATYAPPTTGNVGAPSKPAKDTREPAYRNIVPIESAATADQVLAQVLKNSNVSLTHEQLFSVSPIIRDKLRTLLTPKRVTNEASNYLASSYSNPVLPSVEELLRQADTKGSLPHGVLRIPDPYEAYLSRLGPHDTPQLLTVAKESHALRSILSTIADREEVECVVDPGCQIV